MQAYEAMFIFRPGLQDEEHKGLLGKIEGVLKEQKAESVNIQLFGKRQLAYEIEHCKDGTYYLVNFSAEDNTIPDKLKHLSAVNEKILRILIVKKTKLARQDKEREKETGEKAERGEEFTQEFVNRG